MNKKEKKAIETLKNIVIQEYDWWINKGDYAESNVKEANDAIKTILKLIKKQEKIIDEMADNIFNIIDYGTFIDDIEDLENETEVKQYFYRKVEEDG
jgi:ketol-acid reductoisomerase